MGGHDDIFLLFQSQTPGLVAPVDETASPRRTRRLRARDGPTTRSFDRAMERPNARDAEHRTHRTTTDLPLPPKMLVLFSFSNRTNLAAGKRVAMKSLVSLTKRNTARITTGAITAPADENFGEAGAKAWRRITENGAQQASDIWAGVNSAAAAAAKGTWDGIKPVKKVLFSDVLYSPKREAFMRKWMPTDITYASFIGAMHLGCLLAPFTFTWSAFSCFLVMYFITGCLGITLSYHRQLSHKSFNTPKWVEYTLAYFGAMAVQGDPLEWASSHRYHHQVRVDFPNPDTGRLMPCMECSHASLTTTTE